MSVVDCKVRDGVYSVYLQKVSEVLWGGGSCRVVTHVGQFVCYAVRDCREDLRINLADVFCLLDFLEFMQKTFRDTSKGTVTIV